MHSNNKMIFIPLVEVHEEQFNIHKQEFIFDDPLFTTDFLIKQVKYDIWNYYILKDFLANKRTAVPHTKTRSELSFSGRKTRQQKHTGFARQGMKSSASRIRGVKAFGPKKERSFHKKINKKFFHKFIVNALWKKISENKLIIIKGEICKTQNALDILNQLMNNCLNNEFKSIYLLGNIQGMRNLEYIVNIEKFYDTIKPLCYNHSIIITQEEWNKICSRYNIKYGN